jgi:hypothetical protein
VPQSGCNVVVGAMLEIYATLLACGVYPDTSVFHGLSAGKILHPLMVVTLLGPDVPPVPLVEPPLCEPAELLAPNPAAAPPMWLEPAILLFAEIDPPTDVAPAVAALAAVPPLVPWRFDGDVLPEHPIATNRQHG